jgi:hypothetical protein
LDEPSSAKKETGHVGADIEVNEHPNQGFPVEEKPIYHRL